MTDGPIIVSSSSNRKLDVGVCFLCVYLPTVAFVSAPQLSKPGKISDTFLPTVQNAVNVADLCWDPFDLRRLAVGELLTTGHTTIILPWDSAVE